MQTTSLQNLLNTTGPAAAQRNGNNDSAQGGASFGAMLSNEMELRQPAAMPLPTPAPVAPKADAPKPQAADKPAQPDDAAAQQAAKTEPASKPAEADKTDKADKADADGADSEDARPDQQSAQSSDPASAMLALMASLQQPAKDAKPDGAAGSVAQAFDALGGAAGKGKRGDAAQLAALQTALKSIGKDGSGAGKTFADGTTLSNPALAAAGAGIGADDKRLAGFDAGDKAGFDPRAMGLKAGHADAQLDAAALALQQARETADAREPVLVPALVQAQPAVMASVQAAAVAAEELNAQVGTEAWENQVGQKVVYMVGNDEQTASLTLNPPDLGPLQVVLSVSNDQASVTFSANQEEVRQALENALPRLREMMSESGIALGNATVNAGMPDNGQAREQAARNSGGFGGNGNGRGRGDKGNANDEPAARTVTRTARLGDSGMVDTFA
jgi:flagellar hook-length control protein FliK